MIRAVPFILVGAALGALATWGLCGSSEPGSPPPGPPPSFISCDAGEVSRLKNRVAQLESEQQKASSSSSAAPTVGAAPVAHEGGHDGAQDAVSWRISAIEKFVPLSSEQKDRLREKYASESAAKVNGEEPQTESLDDILGAENAAYYREQVNAAFKRVQNEEVERESVWLSRKLDLSPEQESSVRQVLERVEADVAQPHDTGQSALSPQQRVQSMIAQNRRRAELRNAQLANILTPEQLRTYAQLEAESSASDVEVFHDPGAGQPTTASR